MKKSGLWFLLLALTVAVFTCDGGSGGGGGGDSGDANCDISGVIDVSNTTTCTTALSFGIAGENQEKRFQTFIVDNHTKLDAVEVKIRKNNAVQAYNAITVELYKTSGNLPTDRIAETTVDSSSLDTGFSVIKADLNYQFLVPGIEYAIVLGQDDCDSAGNDGFEWCAAEVNSDLDFGKYENSAWVDESGLGDGWLKADVSGGVCSSVTSYYTGTITVNVEDSLGDASCITAYDNQAVFEVVLENDPSFPASTGQKWKNSRGIGVIGSYLNTYTGSGCTAMPNSISSEGAQFLTPSADAFPVNLIIWDEDTADKYQLIVGGVAFPGCIMQYDSFSSTITAVILVPLMEVAPAPADTTHLSGDQTVPDVSGAQVQVTWSLTWHSN